MSDAVRTFSSAGRLVLSRLRAFGSGRRADAGPAAGAGPRGRLFRKYVLLFIGLVSLVLLINSALDFWFTYDENKAALFRIQQEKAGSAARRIEQFVDEIERQLGWTTAPQWAAAPLDQRRLDLARLLRQVPAITELVQLDDTGREQLKVSRLAIDVVGSDKDYSQSPAFIEAKKHRAWFSPVHFRKESEPYMTMAVARTSRHAGVTVADVNLKLIWDVITALKIGQGGYAYVVDREGRLIAHPDISLVLRNTDLTNLPQVNAAQAEASSLPAPASGGGLGVAQTTDQAVMVAKSIDGKPVLTAHAAIAPLGWTVFVELPLSEALAPLYGAALRTAALLALALALATLAALFLARRMTVPIRQLQAGASRIGAGELERRIEIHTGDELEGLAGEFNRMAADLQKSYADLEKKVEDRTAELKEALDQQTATAEVLGVINSSPGDLAPVFDAMLDRATSLCEASFGILWIFDGAFARAGALHRVPAAYAELCHDPFLPSPGSGPARMMRGEGTFAIADLTAHPPYRAGDALTRAIVDLAGARSLVIAPLRKDPATLGAITLYRNEVRPFTDKQIVLLQNFAAQAVIAMENARLITETREALEQQTATAEVLGVINSSPGYLAPVFDAMLERALRLCDGALGQLWTYDGDSFEMVSSRGVPAPWAELLRGRQRISPDTAHGRLAAGEDLIHIADLADSAAYRSGDPHRTMTVDLGGVRSLLAVSLRHDEKLLGVLAVYRQEVRPFSDKQIALLQNFAAQAVIAMENARLITETREALEQQTATAEVLAVINSSPGELAPVFDAMLEKATRLCAAPFGILRTWDGERFHFGAVHGDPRFCDWVQQRGPIRPGGDDSLLGRIEKGERVVHFADARDENHRTSSGFREMVEASGIRSAVTVALHKDDALLGIITVYRQEVRPFTDKQIALLQNFAAQAVIAMENARLITETREALEQQTATAEVMQVINSSPGDLAPVFDAILEKAHILCGAAHGTLVTYDGEHAQAVATHGVAEPLAGLLRQPFRPLPGGPLARLIRENCVIHIADLAAEAQWAPDDPKRIATAEGGVRTMLFVPLRKDELIIGWIAANRLEVRPFSDKQIALLENFAAQAVIAMENARLITETREALEQQTATAEVLGVINSSPGDLAPVFEAILEKAHTLCGADHGTLTVAEGDRFRAVAMRGMREAFAEVLRQPFYPRRDLEERLLSGRGFVHIHDLKAVEFSSDDPVHRAAIELGGVRTLLMVPLRRDGVLLGYITANREDLRPFSDKQIALLQNFAAQAVIAMENARLITETREALEQQTATAEVLGVINSSPGDLQPVFDAMLDKALALCGAAYGGLMIFDGVCFNAAAGRGHPEFHAWVRQHGPIRPAPGSTVARIVAGEDAVQITDIANDEVYRAGTPGRRALVDIGGFHTLLSVALRKDNTLLGTLQAYRQEIRPFSDKQIALLQNFAAQAVIAMENARLITETREALEQQTATAEVLGVINSSPGDLAPVFDAILEKAHTLCGASHGHLSIYDGDRFHAVATHGVPESFAALLREPFRPGLAVAQRLLAGEDLIHIADMAGLTYEPDDRIGRAAVELGGARTLLIVALRKDNTLLGYLTAHRQEVRPFSDKQIALLENFAAQAVIAMENARLITETREALEQQTATAEVLGVINSSPGDLAPVFDAMLEKAIRLCEATHGHLLTFDGEYFHPTAATGELRGVEWSRRIGAFRPHPSVSLGRITRGERVVHIADVREEEAYSTVPAFREQADLRGIRSQVAVGLLKDNILLGAMIVYRQEVRPFTDKQIALLQNFAAQAVIAMENARLLGELRGRTRDLQESLEYQTATSDVLKVIGQSGADLAPMLQTLVETAARICNADRAVLQQLREGVFRMGASFGLSQEANDYRARTPITPGRGTPIGRMALERRVIHVVDVLADPEFADFESQNLGGFRTMLLVPLFRARTVIGGLFLSRSRVEPFTEKQIALVTTFADQAAIAIENARLFNELRARTAELGRSVDELQMLSEVGQAVSSTLDLRAVLSTILSRSVGLTGADAGAIFRYSRADRSFRLAESVGLDETLAGSIRDLRFHEAETAMGEAAARRAPLQLPDLAQRSSYPMRDVTLAAGFHSALIVPLVGPERILGALTLMRRAVGEFPPETVRLMQTLASQSVLAIQNARLFREIADKSEQLALASQHKSQFLANISHELRTPLNAILGYAELLVDGIYGELADRPKGVLERIQNNGKHLLALINDVLDLAKIEAGQLTLTLEDYSMPEVVQSVVSATEPLATSRGLKFTAILEDGLPKAHGDARRVSQVLLNLVGNAIKFTDEGEVEIRAVADKGQFVLTVRDTGPGIADADQDRIFGEFQQIDDTNTRKKGGTGLGLAISKRMVELQGGTISVESSLGQGSTFRVVLPVHVDEMMEAAE